MRISYEESCRKELVLLLLMLLQLPKWKPRYCTLGRWRSLWLQCSSVAMLVKSHLRRPDREVRNHVSFADPRALNPRTNSFSHFYLCLDMLSLFKVHYGLRENLLFKHSWEMTKIYDALCPKFANGELPRPQSLTAHEMKLRVNNKD